MFGVVETSFGILLTILFTISGIGLLGITGKKDFNKKDLLISLGCGISIAMTASWIAWFFESEITDSVSLTLVSLFFFGGLWNIFSGKIVIKFGDFRSGGFSLIALLAIVVSRLSYHPHSSQDLFLGNDLEDHFAVANDWFKGYFTYVPEVYPRGFHSLLLFANSGEAVNVWQINSLIVPILVLGWGSIILIIRRFCSDPATGVLLVIVSGILIPNPDEASGLILSESHRWMMRNAILLPETLAWSFCSLILLVGSEYKPLDEISKNSKIIVIGLICFSYSITNPYWIMLNTASGFFLILALRSPNPWKMNKFDLYWSSLPVLSVSMTFLTMKIMRFLYGDSEIVILFSDETTRPNLVLEDGIGGVLELIRPKVFEITEYWGIGTWIIVIGCFTILSVPAIIDFNKFGSFILPIFFIAVVRIIGIPGISNQVVGNAELWRVSLPMMAFVGLISIPLVTSIERSRQVTVHRLAVIFIFALIFWDIVSKIAGAIPDAINIAPVILGFVLLVAMVKPDYLGEDVENTSLNRIWAFIFISILLSIILRIAFGFHDSYEIETSEPIQSFINEQ